MLAVRNANFATSVHEPEEVDLSKLRRGGCKYRSFFVHPFKASKSLRVPYADGLDSIKAGNVLSQETILELNVPIANRWDTQKFVVTNRSPTRMVLVVATAMVMSVFLVAMITHLSLSLAVETGSPVNPRPKTAGKSLLWRVLVTPYPP